MKRFALSLGRFRGQILRLVLTVAFLVLGLAVSALALSLQEELARFFRTMDRPQPLWVGETRSGGGAGFFPIYRGDLGQADLDTVARLVPQDLWTPYFCCGDSGQDRLVGVPETKSAYLQYVRLKAFARPSLLTFFHAGIRAGRVPLDSETRNKKYALVTEEVAQTLFGSPGNALGKVLIPSSQGNFPLITGTFEVIGVYDNPSQFEVQYGYPDILFIPDDDLTRVMLSAESHQVYGARMVFDPERVDPKVLAEKVVPALKAAHPELSLDRIESWRGGVSGPTLTDLLVSIHRQADPFFFAATLLTVLFLVVSCLSVLSFMFVSITSRAQEIAVERALGRSFGHFVGQAFLQGGVLVLAASVLALGLVQALLPAVSGALVNELGQMLPDSAGRIRLDLPSAAGLCLGASVLSGLVAILPLLPYRRLPIAAQIKEDS